MKERFKHCFVPHEGNGFRPYLLRTAGVALMAAFIVGAMFASQLYGAALRSTNFLASILPSVLVDLANGDRSAYQLPALEENRTLDKAAQLKANDMAAKGYFAHESPDGHSPWYWFTQAGYHFAYAGENLAVYFDDSAAVNAAWMNSPGHRANILNVYFTQIGIATARGIYQGRDTTFVVQLFGTPIPAGVATSSHTASVAVAAEPRVEPSVEPIVATSSDVLSASSSRTFVAVRNVSVPSSTAAAVVPAQNASPRSSLFDLFASSPMLLLFVAYAAIAILLVALFVSVLVVRHERRGRHAALVAAIFLFALVSFYACQTFAVSHVTLAALPAALQ